MKKKKQQFNIQTSHMDDDIYLLFERLAQKKKLSIEIVKWASFYQQHFDSKKSFCNCDEVLKEVKKLQRMFRHLRADDIQKLEVEPSENVIVDLSSDMTYNTIEEDELDYNF